VAVADEYDEFDAEDFDDIDIVESSDVNADELFGVGTRGDVGRLLLIFPDRYEEECGPEDEQFDAVFADVAILDGPESDIVPEVPGLYKDVMWSCSIKYKLVPRVQKGNMKPVVGRAVKGKGKRSKPSIGLKPATPDEVKIAQAWRRKNRR